MTLGVCIFLKIKNRKLGFVLTCKIVGLDVVGRLIVIPKAKIKQEYHFQQVKVTKMMMIRGWGGFVLGGGVVVMMRVLDDDYDGLLGDFKPPILSNLQD